MKNKKTNPKTRNTPEEQLANLHYPPAEDIFNQLKEEKDIDPEDVSKNKKNIRISNTEWNQKNFKVDRSGADLDVPGTELDDESENTGNEDEENNSYSIGGDDHNDLEEDSTE